MVDIIAVLIMVGIPIIYDMFKRTIEPKKGKKNK